MIKSLSCKMWNVGLAVLLSSQAFAVNKQVKIPKRVVSINLCTDELAIPLAKPGQLVAVTFLVKDPLSSIYYKSAKPFVSHNNSLEQIVSYKPDLILASQYTPSALLNRLRQLGFKIFVVPVARSIDQVNANIIAVGRKLGNVAVAKRLVEQNIRGINAINTGPEVKKTLNVIVYLPGGMSHSGKGLMAQLVKMGGMQNIASIKGYTGWRSVSIEQLLRWNPDLLLVIESYSQHRSMANELFNHPAIQFFQKQNRIVRIPVQWLSCGRPSTLKILKKLMQSRKKYINQHRQ